MKAISIFICLLFICVGTVAAQSQYVGSYVNANGSVTIQFKEENGQIHGLMQTIYGNLAILGQDNKDEMYGKIFTTNGAIEFTARFSGNVLNFKFGQDTDQLTKVSSQHMIAAMDLKPYFTESLDGRSPNNQQQQEPEITKQTQNNRQITTKYAALNDPELQNIMANGQLVFYTRSSYVSDNMASSITYVNYCANGTFSMNYDGSFSVQGDYGGNVHGASKSNERGYWQLISYEGQPAVYMKYLSGEEQINPIVKARLKAGRWKIGRTQYAFARNKVRCN